MQNILIEIIRLLGTKILLAQARPIIIMDLDYNACSSNQVEKKFLILNNLINLWPILLSIEILQ